MLWFSGQLPTHTSWQQRTGAYTHTHTHATVNTQIITLGQVVKCIFSGGQRLLVGRVLLKSEQISDC